MNLNLGSKKKSENYFIIFIQFTLLMVMMECILAF